jgi:hypothetical protein
VSSTFMLSSVDDLQIAVDLNSAGLGPTRVAIPPTVATYSHIGDHITIGCDEQAVLHYANIWCGKLEQRCFIVKSKPSVRERE